MSDHRKPAPEPMPPIEAPAPAEAPPAPAPEPEAPIEQHRAAAGTPAWLWAMVLVRHPAGKHMTRTAYDQTCSELTATPIGGAAKER